MKILMVVLLLMLTISAFAMYYYIEAAYGGQVFIISGRRFEAKTVCFNMYQGDKVSFIRGNPWGCSSTIIYNHRTREGCDVWCR